MFDDVLLLAKGGRTVYLGPTTEVEPFLASHNFVCPLKANAADFAMDVISVPENSARLTDAWAVRSGRKDASGVGTLQRLPSASKNKLSEFVGFRPNHNA
jgi:hypothetical protein